MAHAHTIADSHRCVPAPTRTCTTSDPAAERHGPVPRRPRASHQGPGLSTCSCSPFAPLPSARHALWITEHVIQLPSCRLWQRCIFRCISPSASPRGAVTRAVTHSLQSHTCTALPGTADVSPLRERQRAWAHAFSHQSCASGLLRGPIGAPMHSISAPVRPIRSTHSAFPARIPHSQPAFRIPSPHSAFEPRTPRCTDPTSPVGGAAFGSCQYRSTQPCPPPLSSHHAARRASE